MTVKSGGNLLEVLIDYAKLKMGFNTIVCSNA